MNINWQVRNLKIKKSVLFILISLLLLLCSCTNEGSGTIESKPIRVSVVLPVQNDAYWSEIKNNMEEEIARLGENGHADYKIMIPSVSYNEDLMIELIRQQIAAKVDVLVIPGMENQALLEDLESAIKDGTKVVCIDSDMTNLQDHIYKGTDNITAGRLLAQHAIAMSRGKAVITVVLGEQNNLNQQCRLIGFQDELSKMSDMEIRNIVYDQYDGVTFMDIFSVNQDSDMLVCFEGTGAKVLETIGSSEGKTYQYIFGFDHIEGLTSGMMDGVIVQDIDTMGRKVVDIVEKYALTGDWKAEYCYTDIEFVQNSDTSEKEQ